MQLKWNFENAGEGRRLTVNLDVEPGETPDVKDLSAFVWAYGGTKLDGEAMQPIDLSGLEKEPKLTRSWVSSEPHLHGLYLLYKNRVVHHQDLNPKIG